MSIYGWYMWLRILDKTKNPIRITKATKRDYLITILIFIFTSIFVMTIYRYYNIVSSEFDIKTTLLYIYNHISSGKLTEFRKIIPYIDTFTTGAAFAAMWMMANKKLESWNFWIIVNILSIPLYLIKGLGFTAIQYFIFLILAFMGYYSWKQRIIIQND